jgi:hypothetical protein
MLGWGLIYQQALFVDPSQVNKAFLATAVILILTPVGAESARRILPLLGVFLGGTSPSESERQQPVSRSSSRRTTRGDDDDQ